MKDQSLLLYPCLKSTLPLLRHMLSAGEEGAVTAVAPRGWAMEGRDAGYLDHRGEMGIVVTNDFSGALLNCDTVLVPAFREKMPIEKLTGRIEEALRHGRRVRCMQPLTEDQVAALKSCAGKSGSFAYLPETRQEVAPPPFSRLSFQKKKDSAIPMITVGGVMGDDSSLEVMLGLQARLQEDGYRVAAYAKNPNYMVMGHSQIPSFVTEPGISEEHKIYALNDFLDREARELRPDVMLFEIPAPMIAFSNNQPNGFGALAYICSQAIHTDYFVLCAQYGFMWERFEELSHMFLYRFGFPIHGVAVSNIDYDYTLEDADIVRIYHSDESVLNDLVPRRASLPVEAVCHTRGDELDRLYEHVIANLASE